MKRTVNRKQRFLKSLGNGRAWFHSFRLIHFYNYSHVQPVSRMKQGRDVRISPTASFRNGERIALGDRTHVGEGCMLWAGDGNSSITVGADCLFGPRVSLMASDYNFQIKGIIRDNPRREAPIVIGDNVWLCLGAIVTAGVTIGSNSVIGANAVVTKDVPSGVVVGGIPARQISRTTEISLDTAANLLE